MSDINKRQEFEEYLHLEVQNHKESESLVCLLPFPVNISVTGISPDMKLQSYCFVSCLC